MSRTLAFLAALALTLISVGSTGFAAGVGRLSFTLSLERAERVQLALREEGSRGLSSNSYLAQSLPGLDSATLRSGSGPVSFALVRDPGRLDCSGKAARRGFAAGECRFTYSGAFADLLAARGFGRPDGEEALALTLVGVSRSLVEALAAAGYRPNADDLAALAALEVTPTYIGALARSGAKPALVRDLIAFKALDISPAYLAGLAGEGYRNLRPADVVSLKAVGVTPQYIRAFRAAGYGSPPVSTLIEAKALGVTPRAVRALGGSGQARLTTDDLFQLRVARLMP